MKIDAHDTFEFFYFAIPGVAGFESMAYPLPGPPKQTSSEGGSDAHFN
jgi:hypothetical protein